MKRYLCAAVVGLLALGTVAAADDWTFGIGASVRDVKADFAATTFRNYDNIQSDEGPFGMQNYKLLPGYPFPTITVDYASYDGADVDGGNRDGVGLYLNAQQPLDAGDSLALELVVGLQYFSPSIAAAGGSLGFEQWEYGVVDVGSGPEVFGPPLPGPNATTPQPGTTASVTQEVEADIFVLDLGLRLGTARGPFRLSLAAGPTLTIADTDSEQRLMAAWNVNPNAAPADPGGDDEASSASDTEVALGAYAAVGVGLAVRERVSVSLEGRYDIVNDLGTRQVDLDLDGFSIQLGLRFGF